MSHQETPQPVSKPVHSSLNEMLEKAARWLLWFLGYARKALVAFVGAAGVIVSYGLLPEAYKPWVSAAVAVATSVLTFIAPNGTSQRYLYKIAETGTGFFTEPPTDVAPAEMQFLGRPTDGPVTGTGGQTVNLTPPSPKVPPR